MNSKLGRSVRLGLMMLGMSLLIASAKAETDYHPTTQGGNFGLGLEFGGPGSWGATAKIWTSRRTAFQLAMKFDEGGSALAQADYLWHTFSVIHMNGTKGEMPLYVGLGANLLFSNPTAFAGRVPLGISYIFDKKNVPVDIYLQAVPTLWFFTNSVTDFKVYGELGAHYYF